MFNKKANRKKNSVKEFSIKNNDSENWNIDKSESKNKIQCYEHSRFSHIRNECPNLMKKGKLSITILVLNDRVVITKNHIWLLLLLLITL